MADCDPGYTRVLTRLASRDVERAEVSPESFSTRSVASWMVRELEIHVEEGAFGADEEREVRVLIGSLRERLSALPAVERPEAALV